MLVNERWVVKIADFGTSRAVDDLKEELTDINFSEINSEASERAPLLTKVCTVCNTCQSRNWFVWFFLVHLTFWNRIVEHSSIKPLKCIHASGVCLLLLFILLKPKSNKNHVQKMGRKSTSIVMASACGKFSLALSHLSTYGYFFKF